jgi:hypothetical protein
MALLCEAYRRLGDAFFAEKDHADRDCRGAAKAYAKALGERGSMKFTCWSKRRQVRAGRAPKR